ncbi:MAG TPA: FeoB-associated Cys-rich membrane protein [Treponema sp.]|nr:FeoB-associated Cys-rich membrane protein [Treponema sp.]
MGTVIAGVVVVCAVGLAVFAVVSGRKKGKCCGCDGCSGGCGRTEP